MSSESSGTDAPTTGTATADGGVERGESRPYNHQGSEPLTGVFKRANVQDQLKLMVGVFGAVGVGVGLTAFLLVGELTKSSGALETSLVTWMIGLSALTMVVFLGPVLASVLSLQVAASLAERARNVYATTAVGGYLGFLVMAVLAVVILGLQMGAAGQTAAGGTASSGESGRSMFDLGTLVVPLLLAGLPSAVVAAATAYLAERVPVWTADDRSTAEA